MIAELLPQTVLLDLARSTQWNRVDEDHIIRCPPFRDSAFIKGEQFLSLQFRLRFPDDDQQWTLVLLRVFRGNARCLRDCRMCHRDVFQVD